MRVSILLALMGTKESFGPSGNLECVRHKDATVSDKSRAEPRILTKHFYHSPTTALYLPVTKPSDPRFVTAASHLSCPCHRQRLLLAG
jgi:hypothetical protein